VFSLCWLFFSCSWSGFYFVRPVSGPSASKKTHTTTESDDSKASDSTSSESVSASTKPKQILYLGPFHGKPATVRIPFGKGVCGTAVVERKTQLVPDVHEHPNHIACDSASNAEIVIPVYSATGTLVGVLDMDSPTKNGYTEADQAGLEPIAALIGKACDWVTLEMPVAPDASDDADGFECTLKRHAHR
jgi:GAF domain